MVISESMQGEGPPLPAAGINPDWEHAVDQARLVRKAIKQKQGGVGVSLAQRD